MGLHIQWAREIDNSLHYPGSMHAPDSVDWWRGLGKDIIGIGVRD